MKYDIIKQKIGIHCPTLEETELVLEKLRDMGVYPHISPKHYFNDCNRDLCFRYYESNFMYANLAYYKKEGYQIITAQQFLDSFNSDKGEVNWVEVRDSNDRIWEKRILIADFGERFFYRYRCVMGSDERNFINGESEINTIGYKQMRPIQSIDYSQFKENDIVEVEFRNEWTVGYFNKIANQYLHLKSYKDSLNTRLFSLSEIKKVTKIK